MAVALMRSLGICSTCNNLSECRVRRMQNGHPIWFCEQFDDYTAPVDLCLTVLTPEPDGKLAFKGLCANCEEVLRCTLLKPDSGVWHCEEYR